MRAEAFIGGDFVPAVTGAITAVKTTWIAS
jgi:hypothetical protein